MLLYLCVCINLQSAGRGELKLGLNSTTPNQPAATDYKVGDDTNFAEKVSCYTSFTTTIDPKIFAVPPSCKPPEYYD